MIVERYESLDKLSVEVNEALTSDDLTNWTKAFDEDTIRVLSRLVTSQVDLVTALASRKTILPDEKLFNLNLKGLGPNGDYPGPRVNQYSSGRCWLFATTNVLRYNVIEMLNLGDFQLSQNYLFFYDKLEKANFYLESIIDLAGEDEDSRIISYMNQSPVGDGGQWDMAVNLLEKYGVVPYKIFPDSYSSMASARLDQVLTSKLREYALQLRARPSEAKELKLKYIKEVFNTVSIALGSPPMPTEHFVWEYYDKDNNCHQWEGTPKEYYHQFCKRKNMDPKDSFSLINDPRNKYEKLYTVERLGNAVGGRPVQYVNVSTEALEDAVIAGIKADTPLFIGCDAGKYSERNKGIWDTTDKHQFARSQPNKAQRLRTGESSMTHAMVITAVHLDQNGRPVRYKIENSWSDAVGEGAIMTADWFREFVYQVVVPRGITDKRWTEVLDDGNPTVLKPWDPIATPLQAMAGPSRLHEVVPLPFTIDLSCPSTLSHKPITPWPFEISGPSTRDEDASTFIRRRYLEILLLPDELAPLTDLSADIVRIDPSLISQAITPLLLSVKGIEKRHRQTIHHLVTAIVSNALSISLPEVKDTLMEEAILTSGLDRQEAGLIRVAVELRMGSRKMTESGESLVAKKLVEELEKREALIQVILLFAYIPLHKPTTKKKKKSKRSGSPDTKVTSPLEDPRAALETLLDRLSIWSALADLNLDDGGKGKSKAGEGWQGILQRFWRDILVPSYLTSQFDLCATFHQKIYATPIPSTYLPPSARPTRPSIPSRDEVSRASSVSVRSISRAPSEVSESRAPSTSTNTLHRSVSRTSDTLGPGQGQEMRRSRSRSIDPLQARPAEVPKRPMIRAPSGKDLFKGREVGLMRRTGSMKRPDSLSKREESQVQSSGLGLLGRKTSDPKKRRVSNDDSTSQRNGTIIFATPAKPRPGNPFSRRQTYHPTPIQEEPSIGERFRSTFIAETPSTNRILGTSFHGLERVTEMPTADRIVQSPEPEDDLGELMVMTDEEDEEDDEDEGGSGSFGLIPETPAR